ARPPPAPPNGLGVRWGVLRQALPAPAAEDDDRGRHQRGAMMPVVHVACVGMPRPVPAEIFKAYDVRGLYGEQIDGDVAEAIGRAFVRVLAQLGGRAQGDLRVGLG